MKTWNNFLKSIETKLGKKNVDKWLRSLKVITFDACNLYLQAENFFQVKWFEEHVRTHIKKTLYNENYHPIKVHLTINRNQDKEKSNTNIEAKYVKQDSFNLDHTFENFISTNENMIVYKLFLEVSSTIKSSFNPIFIFGKKSTGKTHLLTSLMQSLKEKKVKVFFVNASSFTKHVVDAIRFGKMQEFRNEYRNIDVLIIDDIHILSNKNATQEEFFHTFNTLHTLNKTIVLSSNQPSSKLEGIAPRLTSRFDWGISLELQALDNEGLQKALSNNLKSLNLSINSEIQKFLLNNFSTLDSLKKALKTITLNQHLEKVETLDIFRVKKYISHLLVQEKNKKLTHEKIIYSISNYYGITNNDILGKSQTKECSHPRQLSMYLIRELLKMPYMKIGSIFKRDHSTVMTSIKTIQKQVDLNKKNIYYALLEIKKKLTN
ncbi:MAG: Chromosomal replication initiator protein DnaA [Candidatus Anoxychlamydiales bacterium]|nr:Chromosomal replication initiator protein DnaA [Candidatus Anoxychlamydiales bacterium]